jgi:iron(III) transport system substrate-binding protein
MVSAQRVVIYCALDREFAEQILKDFTEQTGLHVVPKYDTEATKSVGLFQDLVHEAAHPRCDLFWNNEIINTIRLQRKGLLAPYSSAATAAFPAKLRAADDTWHAFATRVRVILVNTDKVAATDRPNSLLDLTKPRWRGKVALAKPQFGTTATEAACLFQVWGADKAAQFYRDLNANEIHIVSGNKQVAEGVGSGLYEAGMTDTDDAMAEVRAGKPVALVFPDADPPEGSGRGTLFIPNTLALVKNSPNPEGARRLMDFLLSPEVEAKLARSDSCQVPLNPAVKIDLPPAMQPIRHATPLSVDFEKAADQWQVAQRFLKGEFAR